MSMAMSMATIHIGRSFNGPGDLEAKCPCPKQPCGLVLLEDADRVQCPEHAVVSGKTIRTVHQAEDCQGPKLEGDTQDE